MPEKRIGLGASELLDPLKNDLFGFMTSLKYPHAKIFLGACGAQIPLGTAVDGSVFLLSENGIIEKEVSGKIRHFVAISQLGELVIAFREMEPTLLPSEWIAQQLAVIEHALRLRTNSE